MLKTCTICKCEKPIAEFGKNSRMEDGYHYTCKVCRREQSKKYKEENKDKIKISSAIYYVKNKTRIDKQNKKWKEENPDKVSESGKSLYERNRNAILANQKEYRCNNRAKLNSKAAKERASKNRATPSWLTQTDKEFIEVAYAMAKIMSKMTDEVYHVDHIDPLNGKEICGLHVPLNLRVILAEENLSKGNRLVKE